jgi:hypothetical protein
MEHGADQATYRTGTAVYRPVAFFLVVRVGERAVESGDTSLDSARLTRLSQ